MSKITRPPFKCHGGKFYLESWIIEQFPANYESMDYIEPYIGGGSVLLNKLPSTGMEIINDLDEGVVQIFRALRDEPTNFIGRLKRTKYSENTFNRALKKSEDTDRDYVDHAVNEFILRRMSRGGLKTNFAWSDRERNGQPGDVNAWETIIRDHLPKISKRIEHIHIFNKSALEIIQAFNDANTLLYCDPPYVAETRVSKDAYSYEMSTDDHIALSEAIHQFKGKVIISGYPSALYKRLFSTWRCVKRKIANHASQQKVKKMKTEQLWINY